MYSKSQCLKQIFFKTIHIQNEFRFVYSIIVHSNYVILLYSKNKQYCLRYFKTIQSNKSKLKPVGRLFTSILFIYIK